MNLNRVRDALLSVGLSVDRYYAEQKEDRYIVWAEDGQASALNADDHQEAFSITGTVDFFTRHENDPMVDTINKALSDADVPHRINSVQYEQDEGYIHYEWVWEMETWPE